jgi:hypothetical protein
VQATVSVPYRICAPPIEGGGPPSCVPGHGD